MNKVFHEPVEGPHFPKVVVPVPKEDVTLEKVDLVQKDDVASPTRPGIAQGRSVGEGSKGIGRGSAREVGHRGLPELVVVGGGPFEGQADDPSDDAVLRRRGRESIEVMSAQVPDREVEGAGAQGF